MIILTTTGKLKRLTKRTTLTLSCTSRAVRARPDTTYIPGKQMLMSVRSIVTITRGYDDYVYLIPILPVIPGNAGNRTERYSETKKAQMTVLDPTRAASCDLVGTLEEHHPLVTVSSR